MNNKVQFPEFELVGPSCKKSGCKGVLVNHLTLHEPKMFFLKCSVCDQKSGHMPVREKLAHAVGTIMRLVEGVPSLWPVMGDGLHEERQRQIKVYLETGKCPICGTEVELLGKHERDSSNDEHVCPSCGWDCQEMELS